MSDSKYWIAISNLYRWRAEKKNRLIVKIIKEKKMALEEFFNCNDEEYKTEFALNDKEISDINNVNGELDDIENTVKELERNNIKLIPLNSSDYPKTLKENLGMQYSPSLLYVKGDISIFENEKAAVVGSRKVSDKGLKFAQDITKKLVKEGNTIVSGFAKGVDRASLDVSLAEEGKSIIVLPQGILTFNTKSYQDQINKGNVLVLSTFYPTMPWSVGLAMGRNRYIYGLADNIYVAESGAKGGTWSGVVDGLKKIEQFNMSEYRKIYVRITSPDERCANNKLIEMGATGLDDDLNVIESNINKFKQSSLFS